MNYSNLFNMPIIITVKLFRENTGTNFLTHCNYQIRKRVALIEKRELKHFQNIYSPKHYNRLSFYFLEILSERVIFILLNLKHSIN